VRNLRYDRAEQLLVAMIAVGVLWDVVAWARTRGASGSDPFAFHGSALIAVPLLAFLLAPIVACGVRFVFANEYFAASIPGVLPAAGESPKKFLGQPKGIAPVRFSPPDGMRPAEVGMVLTGTVGSRHLAASIVDLTRRGYIVAVAADGGWTFRPGLLTLDDLREHERVLLHGLFDERPSVSTEQLAGRSAALLGRVRRALGREAADRHWLRCDPTTTSRYLSITGIVLAGFGLMTLAPDRAAGAAPGSAYISLTWFAAAAVFAGLVGRRIGRTAVGTVMRQQAEGFRLYLATAEAGQLRAEEEAGRVTQYLPYAIVMGLADRWRGVVDELSPLREPLGTAPTEPSAAWVDCFPSIEDAVVSGSSSR